MGVSHRKSAYGQTVKTNPEAPYYKPASAARFFARYGANIAGF
jgi:hypothetical protein